VTCHECPFSAWSESEENAEKIREIHGSETIFHPQDQDAEEFIHIGGGYHKTGLLGFVDRERISSMLRQVISQVQEERSSIEDTGLISSRMKDMEDMLRELDQEIGFPDDQGLPDLYAELDRLKNIDQEEKLRSALESWYSRVEEQMEQTQNRHNKKDKVLEAVGSEPVTTAEVANQSGLPRGDAKQILQELRGEEVAVFDTMGRTRRWISK